MRSPADSPIAVIEPSSAVEPDRDGGSRKIWRHSYFAIGWFAQRGRSVHPMKKLLLLPALLIIGGALTPVPAQRYPVFQSELKRIFEDKEFDPAEPRGFHWLPDGASFSMLQLQDDSTILV